LLINNRYWVIIDVIEGEGTHKYDINYHFHQDIELKYNKNDNSYISSFENSKMLIKQNYDINMDSKRIEGYNSPEYGILHKSKILKFTSQGILPKIVITYLYPINEIEHVESYPTGINIEKIKLNKSNKPKNFIVKIIFNEYTDNIVYFNTDNKKYTNKIIYHRC